MKNVVVLAGVALLLPACQGGFAYIGTVSASSGTLPNVCRATVRHEGDPKPWHEVEFSPPKLEGRASVAPFKGNYEMTVRCVGYMPFTRQFEYGGSSVTPRDPLQLGVVVLIAEHGT